MEIYEKLRKAKKIMHNSQIDKSKKNDFAKFKYMELLDIIPVVDKIEEELNVTVTITFLENEVVAYFIDCENGDKIEFKSYYSSDLATGQIKGVQQIGAHHTYFRRYMYMLIFEIIENDIVEEKAGEPIKSPKLRKKVDNKLKFTELHKKNQFSKEEIKQITKGKKSEEMNAEDWAYAVTKALDLLTERELT